MSAGSRLRGETRGLGASSVEMILLFFFGASGLLVAHASGSKGLGLRLLVFQVRGPIQHGPELLRAVGTNITR